MKRSTIVRLALWVIAGTVFGLLLIGPSDDWLRRFPLIWHIVNFMAMPAVLLSLACAMTALSPPGDAGFGVMVFFMVAIWPIYGLLIGAFIEWRLMKRKVAEQNEPPGRIPSRIQRCCLHIKRRKFVYIAAVVLCAVCSYCIVQNKERSQERKMYFEKIDRKAVAEAFYEIVTHPEKHQKPFGSDSSRNPQTDSDVPEVIRLLKPKYLYVRGEGPSKAIALTQNHYTYLVLEHPFGDLSQYDLVYQEGPSSTDPRTILYSISDLTSEKQNTEFGQQAGPGYPPQGVGSPDP